MGKFGISGAGGNLGKATLKHLERLVGPERIVAATRHPEQLASEAARGVEVRFADFNKPESLNAAYRGVDRLLIISSGNYQEILAGKRVGQHLGAIDAAVNAGVSHIAYTSCADAGNSDIKDHSVNDHSRTEDGLAKSGIEWTALRNNIYMGGVAYFLSVLICGREILLPGETGAPCWVSHEDCARSAAYLLAQKSDIGGPVEITGPEALDFAELAERWGKGNGRTIRPAILPPEEIIERVVAKGVPRATAQGIVGNASGVMRYLKVKPSDAVLRITGTAPESVDGVLKELVIN
jgi:NAD(P)H dehydrogenase (quinone)